MKLPQEPSASPAREDEAFLEEIERTAFLYFWETGHPESGLVPDRAKADGSAPGKAASIAAVGFGLPVLCIGHERNWGERDAIYERVLRTLKTFRDRLTHERGFYYHFLDMETGERMPTTELSSIDTALFLAGALTAGEYFKGTEVEALARELYERADFRWMLDGSELLSHGWTPEGGFLPHRWSGYCELMILYVLALGSPTHAIGPESWNAWLRKPVMTYEGKTFAQCPPLFTHQFSHAFIDFKNKRDAFADYWRNTRLATQAQREFCMSLREQFPGYTDTIWGMTSADGPDGYEAWGGPPVPSEPPAPIWPRLIGIVVPCAPGGSIPFLPAECIGALRDMRARYGDRIWKRYGFADSFIPDPAWTAPDVIGIDVGITALMAENHRTGFVWRHFMKNQRVAEAMKIAGFRSTDPRLPEEDMAYLRDLARDTWKCIESLVHPDTGLPYDNSSRSEMTSVSNIGLYLTDVVAARDLGLITAAEAEQRIARTVASLKQFKTTFGFQQSWNSVTTLQPDVSADPWISILDSGNLAGGLITAAEAFPSLRDECYALARAMQWGVFLDKNGHALLGGYHVLKSEFNEKWKLTALGADSRLAVFLAVASKAAPPAVWTGLDRSVEKRYATEYLKPGWQGGGLFMQYINGLWLDDETTLMGQSAENFAYAQMAHAAANAYPAWGWSASSSPAGAYLGWGALRDEIVTPHACALPIRSFPQEVVANLRALERLGARHPSFGFYDAVDIKSGEIAKTFLVLDQSMLFLSLANYLGDNQTRRWFQQSPLVKEGRALIPDYQKPAFGDNRSILLLSDD